MFKFAPLSNLETNIFVFIFQTNIKSLFKHYTTSSTLVIHTLVLAVIIAEEHKGVTL